MPDKFSELLTVLLVIRDRKEFTFRWLKYAYDFKLPFNLLIADGGSNDAVDQYISDNNLRDRLKINYIKTEYDDTRSIYYRKIDNALRLIDTKYVIFADDDDFFSIEALQESLQFLEENSDYVSCGGSVIHFSVNEDRAHRKKVIFDREKDVEPYIDGKSIKRLKQYFLGGSGVYYNINKTSLVKIIWLKITKNNFKNIRLPEVLMEGFLISSGKVHFINKPTYFRQHGEGIGNTAGLSHDLMDEILMPSWSSEVNIVLTILAANCERDDEAKCKLLEWYKYFIIPPLINGLDIDEKNRTLMFKKIFRNGKYKKLFFYLKNLISFLSRTTVNNYAHDSVKKIDVFLKKE